MQSKLKHYIYLAFTLLLVVLPDFAEAGQNFDSWLSDFKKEALTHGISQQVLDDAFANVAAPSQDILDLDHKQPEHTKMFMDYVDGIVTEKRVAKAREKWRENRKLLKRIYAKYHVPPQILLALWGLESNFGEHQGTYSVIESLATLAYDGRRSQFFRGELLNALDVMQEENIAASDMTGSWAGAMGQTQFMPSSFIKFAVDFDRDGKKDIWNSDADALASIANYFHSKGWDRKHSWGMEVALPEDMDAEDLRANKVRQTLKEWKSLGVTRPDGKPLPSSNLEARLVIPEDTQTVPYLVFPNYEVIMDWNRSVYFATSIGLLADAIGKK